MLGFGFTGCTVGPDYQSPEITAAPRRTPLKTVDVPSRTVERKIDSAWWKSFRDSKLSSVVEKAGGAKPGSQDRGGTRDPERSAAPGRSLPRTAADRRAVINHL